MKKMCFLFLPLILFQSQVHAKIKYRTFFGNCPAAAVGKLSLQIVNNFEKFLSLRVVKQEILHQQMEEKFFLEDYQISYCPVKKELSLHFKCPKPLLKVQIYKEDQRENYEAVLVDHGKLFDPTYEVLLKAEDKLKEELPSLALPVKMIDSPMLVDITRLVKEINPSIIKKTSELILNEDSEMTMILSVMGHACSVFLGKGDWDDKILKLQRIINYVEEKEKVPTIINLTNPKKIVVKFSDNF